MKISNLPKATRSKSSDLLTIVQGNATKVISVNDFTSDITSNLSKLSKELQTIRTELFKRSLNKNNPVLAKSLKIPEPTNVKDATTKYYVDQKVAHTVKIDGTSKIVAPLTYDNKFSFQADDLVTKEYADSLLDQTLKTVKGLTSNAYPKAATGDMFIANVEYDVFAGDGPALQRGDILICLQDSEGGTHGSSSSQFAIVNTNVVIATEQDAGILKIASDAELQDYSSDSSAITPKKLKDALLSNSIYNRKLIDVSSYIVLEDDKGILAVDNRRSASTITLPAVQSLAHPSLFKMTIKDEFGQADLRNITIKSTSSTIDGKRQIVLSNKYQAVTVYNDGLNYYIENNTHAEDEIVQTLSQAGKVATTTAGADNTLFEFNLDLSQFDVNEGFSFEAAGSTAANGNTKTIKLVVDGNTTVTNATTTAPNNKGYIAKVTVLKGSQYAMAFGQITFDGVAPDVYFETALNLDWDSRIDIGLVANPATTASDISANSAILQPIK